jgi:hypothetical protein
MWSHYSNQHKGICLEFGVDNPIFGAAQEVRYLLDYPKLAPHLVADPEDPPLLFTKSIDWKYEREYGIVGLSASVKRSADPSKGVTEDAIKALSLDGDFLAVPKWAIKAVIVGCEADFAAVEKAVRTVSADLPLKRSVRSPSQYRLMIEK